MLSRPVNSSACVDEYGARYLARHGKKFAGRGVSNALLFSELEVQIFSPAQFIPLTYEGCSQLTNCDLKA